MYYLWYNHIRNVLSLQTTVYHISTCGAAYLTVEKLQFSPEFMAVLQYLSLCLEADSLQAWRSARTWSEAGFRDRSRILPHARCSPWWCRVSTSPFPMEDTTQHLKDPLRVALQYGLAQVLHIHVMPLPSFHILRPLPAFTQRLLTSIQTHE